MNQGPDKKIMVVLAIACLLIMAYAVAGVVEGAHADEPMECTDQMVPLAPAKATEASAQVAAAAFEAPEEEPVEEYVEEYADYVTEMKLVKHPYDRGIQARAGVEF